MTNKEIADKRRELKKEIKSCKGRFEYDKKMYRNSSQSKAELDVAKNKLVEFEDSVKLDK